jgi:hypothetical protein
MLLVAGLAGVALAVLVVGAASAFPENCNGSSCSGSATDSIPASAVCQPGTAVFYEVSYLPSDAQNPHVTKLEITPNPPCTGAKVSQPHVEPWPAHGDNPDGTAPSPPAGKAPFRFTWTVSVPTGSTPIGPMNVKWSIAWTKPSTTSTGTSSTTTTATETTTATACPRGKRCADFVGVAISVRLELPPIGLFGLSSSEKVMVQSAIGLTAGDEVSALELVRNGGPDAAKCSATLKPGFTPPHTQACSKEIGPGEEAVLPFDDLGLVPGGKHTIVGRVVATDATDPVPGDPTVGDDVKVVTISVQGSPAQVPSIQSDGATGASGGLAPAPRRIKSTLDTMRLS